MRKSLTQILLFLSLVFSSVYAYEFPENFHQIEEPEQKKEEFLKTLLPVVITENQTLIEERKFVEEYFSRDFLLTYNQRIGSKNHQKLAKLAKKYQISNLYDKESYLKKIDVIPISLALSQAALESGWGSSYYTKKYNNLFGHYTFYSGVPSRAVTGKRERIRVFDSLQESVRSYMHNLNTHWAYREFREARQKARKQNGILSGSEAVAYLKNYSEIGDRYGKLLRHLISTNNLDYYDYALLGTGRVASVAQNYPLSSSLLGR